MVNHFPAGRPMDVLGDGTRRAIVMALAERPRPATDLARLFRITKPAISRHLRLLRARGVVEDLRIPQDGRVRLYRLRPESLDDLQRWVQTVRAFWGHQLGAFADYARADAVRARPPRGRKPHHSRRRQER